MVHAGVGEGGERKLFLIEETSIEVKQETGLYINAE